METQTTTPCMPQPTPASQNADKNPKLDSYDAADNAYNFRYKKTRRSYATVRKIAKKFKFLRSPPKRRFSIREAATIAGVDKTTPYRWCEQDPDFAQAWRESRNTLLENLEMVAYQRASKGSERMLALLLKAHMPDTYYRRPSPSAPASRQKAPQYQRSRRACERMVRDLMLESPPSRPRHDAPAPNVLHCSLCRLRQGEPREVAMDFGMFTMYMVRENAPQIEAFREWMTLIELAEDVGLDSVWLGETHFRPQRAVLASPLVVAGAVSARTSRINVGIAVQVLPLANPVRVAEEAAMIDHMSEGRLVFGVGRSSFLESYQGYNVDYGESRARYFEALEIILRGWTEESFSFEGEFYSFHNVNVVPKPFQKPHPAHPRRRREPRHLPHDRLQRLPHLHPPPDERRRTTRTSSPTTRTPAMPLATKAPTTS